MEAGEMCQILNAKFSFLPNCNGKAMEVFHQECYIFMSLEDPSDSQVKNEQWLRIDSKRDDSSWGSGDRDGGRRSD